MKNFGLLIALIFSSAIMAQPKDFEKKKEKMDAMRVAFITDEVELTSEEAQVFWPIFNEMSKKEHALRKPFMEKMHSYKKEGKSLEDIPEKELASILQERVDNDIKLAKLKAEYHQKFVDVLGTTKTAKLYMSEMRFQRKLIQHSRGGHEGKGGPKGEK